MPGFFDDTFFDPDIFDIADEPVVILPSHKIEVDLPWLALTKPAVTIGQIDPPEDFGDPKPAVNDSVRFA